jgi:hypothetical protein
MYEVSQICHLMEREAFQQQKFTSLNADFYWFSGDKIPFPLKRFKILKDSFL